MTPSNMKGRSSVHRTGQRRVKLYADATPSNPSQGRAAIQGSQPVIRPVKRKHEEFPDSSTAIPSLSKSQGPAHSNQCEEPILESRARPAKRIRVNSVQGVPFLKEVITEVDEEEANASPIEGGEKTQVQTTYVVELTEEELQFLLEPS